MIYYLFKTSITSNKMPEVIEVLKISESLKSAVQNKTLIGIDWTPRAKIYGFENIRFPLLVKDVTSYGKKCLIHLGDSTIVVSFGMEGRFTWDKKNHSNISFSFGKFINKNISTNKRIIKRREKVTESVLYFDDYRYFGSIELVDNIKEYIADKLGPHVLDEKFTLSDFKQIFKKKSNKQICCTLTDQEKIAGIGNYLKCDILYMARIHPARITSSLTDLELEAIFNAMRLITTESYKYNGLTIKSYWDLNGVPGTYPTKVYNRKTDDHGNKILKEKFKDGRTTHYVSELQK